MSGMYTRVDTVRTGLGDASDIPLIGGIIGAVETKYNEAVAWVARQYAEFTRAADDAPAYLADARAVRDAVYARPGVTASQMALADNYLQSAESLVNEASNRSTVDRVMDAYRKYVSPGLGALPLVVAAVGIVGLTTAVVTVGNVLSAWERTKQLRIRAEHELPEDTVPKSPLAQTLDSAKGLALAGIGLLVAYLAFTRLRK